MSVVRIDDAYVDTDFVDTDICTNCGEEFIEQEGCSCNDILEEIVEESKEVTFGDIFENLTKPLEEVTR